MERFLLLPAAFQLGPRLVREDRGPRLLPRLLDNHSPPAFLAAGCKSSAGDEADGGGARRRLLSLGGGRQREEDSRVAHST